MGAVKEPQVERITFGDLRLALVPLHLLVQRRANYRAMNAQELDTLRGSMERFGFKSFILVEEQPDGYFGVVDGHHRWAMAKERGMERVPVVLLDAPDSTSTDLAMLSFNVTGSVVPDVYLDLIRELDAKVGHDDLARMASVNVSFLEDITTAIPSIHDLLGPDTTVPAERGDTNKARGSAVSIMLPRSPEVEDVLARVAIVYPAGTQAESVLAALRASLIRPPAAPGDAGGATAPDAPGDASKGPAGSKRKGGARKASGRPKKGAASP